MYANCSRPSQWSTTPPSITQNANRSFFFSSSGSKWSALSELLLLYLVLINVLGTAPAAFSDCLLLICTESEIFLKKENMKAQIWIPPSHLFSTAACILLNLFFFSLIAPLESHATRTGMPKPCASLSPSVWMLLLLLTLSRNFLQMHLAVVPALAKRSFCTSLGICTCWQCNWLSERYSSKLITALLIDLF